MPWQIIMAQLYLFSSQLSYYIAPKIPEKKNRDTSWSCFVHEKMQVQKDDLSCLRMLTHRSLIQNSKHKPRLLYFSSIDLGLNLQDPFLRYLPSIQFHAKSLQSCQILCDPMDCNLPGSSAHGILQTRILEWACHALLQGIFPTKGSNLSLLWLLHCKWILHHSATRETLHQATVHGTQRARHNEMTQHACLSVRTIQLRKYNVKNAF